MLKSIIFNIRDINNKKIKYEIYNKFYINKIINIYYNIKFFIKENHVIISDKTVKILGLKNDIII